MPTGDTASRGHAGYEGQRFAGPPKHLADLRFVQPVGLFEPHQALDGGFPPELTAPAIRSRRKRETGVVETANWPEALNSDSRMENLLSPNHVHSMAHDRHH
jgi:hypothetical protein